MSIEETSQGDFERGAGRRGRQEEMMQEEEEAEDDEASEVATYMSQPHESNSPFGKRRWQ